MDLRLLPKLWNVSSITNQSMNQLARPVENPIEILGILEEEDIKVVIALNQDFVVVLVPKPINMTDPEVVKLVDRGSMNVNHANGAKLLVITARKRVISKMLVEDLEGAHTIQIRQMLFLLLDPRNKLKALKGLLS